MLIPKMQIENYAKTIAQHAICDKNKVNPYLVFFSSTPTPTSATACIIPTPTCAVSVHPLCLAQNISPGDVSCKVDFLASSSNDKRDIRVPLGLTLPIVSGRGCSRDPGPPILASSRRMISSWSETESDRDRRRPPVDWDMVSDIRDRSDSAPAILLR